MNQLLGSSNALLNESLLQVVARASKQAEYDLAKCVKISPLPDIGSCDKGLPDFLAGSQTISNHLEGSPRKPLPGLGYPKS